MVLRVLRLIVGQRAAEMAGLAVDARIGGECFARGVVLGLCLFSADLD